MNNLFFRLSLAVLLFAATTLTETPGYAAMGRACFKDCQAWLTRTNNWKTLPRGYCRQKCNYYVDAPADVLRKAGVSASLPQSCLDACRRKMRPRPGFLQNSANKRYCKDKCGVQ